MRLERVAVIGAGAWGTALAEAAARAGRQVTLVGRDAEVLADVATNHRNRRHLGDLALDANIAASAEVPDADFIILAVPAQASRAALQAHGDALNGRPVVLTAKGLEAGTHKRQSEILAETVPSAIPYVLSGPSFAIDVAAGRPTAVTLAGDDAEQTSLLAAALAGPSFRPYAADDRLGVEIAGALKNVYALGCGAVEGAGLGASARAALIARAYAELNRIVVRLGGSSHTLAGLAGIGDLTLSCTSTQSRNYRYGIALANQGEVDEIGLAEGVSTAPVALQLVEALDVDAPLIAAVNLLISGTATIDTIVAGLMARPLKREH